MPAPGAGMNDRRCHCAGLDRSRFLRRAAAEAGRGLPAIEPGMPTPAGTGLSRRSFLARGSGLAVAVYGANQLGFGALQEGVAAAASAGPQRVLVSIFLPGGADGMSVLAPTGDPRYRQLRPTLAQSASAGTAFSEDSRLRWSPSAAGLSTLHGEGKVTVLPAIGYDHPDQSHFTSRHFWEVGATDTRARYGWLGRYLDVAGTDDNPLQGLSLDGDLSPALAPAKVPVAAVERPEDFSFWVPGVGDPVEQPMLAAFGDLGRLTTTDPVTAGARKVAREVDSVRRQLAPFATPDGQPSYHSPVTYPDGDFAQRLAALGAMLAAGLPLRCVTINADGGYDTHSGQADSLPTDVKGTCDAVLAFQRDIEARGLADRVLVTVWSEFGRRPEENGSGTDHGAAGAAFLVGSKARGQMVGEFPGLATLDDDDNLRATSDFRAMYCSLLEQWFNFDPARVIPNASSFGRPALVKS
ncbi:MAG: hypothetical protein QOJ55_2519 [Solirubrobacteraceae bacterium]|nr:hypothetical protein [Solirubrobacteraceae bacterium]